MAMRHDMLLVAVVALVTIALRFAPFVIFRGSKPLPPSVRYLSRVLPCAVMGMLVVYCLRNVQLATTPHGVPEAIACLAVVGLHLWKRNTLLSILGGTVSYMLMVQCLF